MPMKGRASSAKKVRENMNRVITFGKNKTLRSKSPGLSSEESDGKDKKIILDKDAQLAQLNPSMADPG